MKLEAFFEKFELFAEAPDAVGRMRELVLELAVQGKLVDQKRSDGDAAQLLDSIFSERNTRSAKLRTPNEPASADGNDYAFPIPSNWAWTQLGKIALQIQYGYTASADSNAKDIRMLRITDIQNNRVDWPSVPGCQIESDEAKKYLLSKNDILIARTGGTIGKSFIVPDAPVKSVFASYLIRVTPPQSIEAQYLKTFLEAPLYWTQLQQMSAGTGQPNVNGQALGRLALPLPPLAEQKRIVAKVDELMALCDRLEAQQRERDARHAVLARASLTRFADAPTPANLNLLFHQSYAISPEEIRKAILTLAVQGKLVPQDPNDEPADALIACIALQRRAKKAKEYTPIDSDSVPFEVPNSWTWVRLGNLCLTSDSGWSPQCCSESRSGNEWGVLKVSAVSWGGFDPEANKALTKGMEPRPECEVRPGDFLLSRANTEDLVARSVVVDQTPPHLMMSDKIVRFTFPDEIDKSFINLANLSAPSREFYMRNASGTSSSMKNIGREVMCNLPVALPPLAEQRRIVAKVDQLMALVDQLEAQLATASNTATQLLDALVAELTGTVRRAPGRVEPQLDQGDIATPDHLPSASASMTSASNAGRAGARPSRDGEPSATDAATLLALLRERGSLSSSEAQTATGLDPATLRGQFKTLIDQGLARTVGQRRGMRYLSLKNVVGG